MDSYLLECFREGKLVLRRWILGSYEEALEKARIAVSEFEAEQSRWVDFWTLQGE